MSNEQLIWSKLLTYIPNPYGVAGLMGNLYAESRLDPLAITNKAKKTKQEYISAIVDGNYTREQFSKDGAAFGIAQWLYWSRKQGLWDYAVENGGRVGSLDMQLGYLVQEIKTYKSIWYILLNAKSVREVSDIVLEKYERPASMGESIKARRAAYGERYFKMFSGKVEKAEVKATEEPIVSLSTVTLVSEEKKFVVTTIEKLNARSGNGKGYRAIAQLRDAGTRLEFVAKAANNWYAVKLPDGAIGWIDGAYLEEA